ncbi:peptidoglycan-binding protein [Falsihalocynthiibacter sp. S25ZX9]|uniref:peptidoglycan-binding domain-containing protein n=1 Tax=Falsihalocynthiibacter sp. S25ZX9 TaxID=3240870 RepID=UPI0035106E31
MSKINMTNPKRGYLRATAVLLSAAFGLSACVDKGVHVASLSEPELAVSQASAPPNAREGSCWARDETPATIQTTTEKFLVEPEEVDASGTITKPAIYRVETRQEITRQRDEIWFETPCSETIGEDFILNLQRALSVRGYYAGPINGEMDSPTRQAVRKYQEIQGLNSSIVSLEAGQQLGLSNYILD